MNSAAFSLVCRRGGSLLASALMVVLLSGCGGGGGGSNATVTVTRVGLSAVPLTVYFGDVRVGQSLTQTATIKNGGTSAITISNVTVAGTGFTITTPTLPISLNPGDTTDVSAKFSPDTAGTLTGSVAVTATFDQKFSFQNNSSNVSVALSGNGVSASLVTSPASIDFGPVAVGSSSTKAIQLTLNLSQSTSPSSITATVSGGTVTGGGFSVSGSPFPLVLSGGQTSTLTLEFAPQSSGSKSGSLSLSSDTSTTPTVVSLAGTGVTTVHSVALAWDQPAAVSGVTVTGYNIYRQDAASGCSGSVAGKSLVGSTSSASSTTFTDNTVFGGHTYCYVVTATASSGESTGSNEVQAVVPSP